MGIHTGSGEKHEGRDCNFGGPTQLHIVGGEGLDTTAIMAALVVTAGTPQTITPISTPAILAEPLHCRILRATWAAGAIVPTMVTLRLLGRDFWNNRTERETFARPTAGNFDTLTAYNALLSAEWTVHGPVGATATVSIGIGDGHGTPQPFQDVSLIIGGFLDTRNKDIKQFRNPATGAVIAPTALNANPHNSVVLTGAPTAIHMEMQTRFGDDFRSSNTGIL